MAEPEVEAKETPEKKPKVPLSQSSLVKVLLGVAIVVVILGLVFMVAYLVSSRMPPTGQRTETSGVGAEKPITDPLKAFDLGQFTVIIFDEAQRSYNLRVHILLTYEAKREEVSKELPDRKDQLVDGVYEVLIGMDPKNFMGSPTQRAEGYAELKASIIRSVNARMTNKINGVYLTEFIFQ